MGWYLWVAAALLLGVIEMMSLDLVLIMFAGGAVGAAVASGFGVELVGQILVFGVVSCLLLFALRPWALHRLRAKAPLTETGTAAHVGRVGVVVSEVTEDGGRIKLVGEVWTARSTGASVFPVGADVRVVMIDGATAVVDAIDVPYTPSGPLSGLTP